jgi:hypothetical protein
MLLPKGAKMKEQILKLPAYSTPMKAGKVA